MKANQEYIELLMTGLSAQTGVKLVPDKVWKASQSKKELHYRKEDLTNLPFDVVRGLILHEMGHLLYSAPFDGTTEPVKKYGSDIMATIYNTFEDMRIERRLEKRFGNYARFGLDSVDAWGVEQHLFNSGGQYHKLPKVEQFLIVSLFRFYALYTTDYQVANYLGQDAEYIWSPDTWTYPIATFDKKVKARHKSKRRIIQTIINDCYRAETSADLQMTVDTELVPIIKDFLEDKKDQKQREEQKKKQQQQQQGQGGGKPQAQPQQGQGNGKKQEGDANASGAQDKSGGENIPMEMINAGGKGFSTTSPTKMKKNKIAKPTENEANALMRSITYVFAQKLKDVLKEQKSIRFTGNHKSGKLLNKNAYKVAIGGETRIFSRRNNPDTPQYAVYIAIDSSGSMNGDRATYAFLGACLIKGVCKQLNFDIKIYEYDTEVRELESLDDYTGCGGGTNDSVAIGRIVQDVDATKDNLVFVVTDGDTYRDADFDVLKKKLKEKNATTYGIGIGDEYIGERLKQNYDNAVYVEKVEELPMKFLQIVKSIIHR